MTSASQPLHSPETPLQLLPCAGSVVLVYCNGDVGVVSGKGGVVDEACSLVLKRRKDWVLSMAAVSCDRTVCVVGAAGDVTVGIAELAEGKLRPPVVTSVPSRGVDLVSSCVCEDKLLLLC